MSNSQNVFSVRLSDDEVAKLKQLAKETALKETVIVRQLIRGAKVEPVSVVTWSVKCDPTASQLCLPN